MGQIQRCQGPWSNFLTIDHGSNSRVSWSLSVPPPPYHPFIIKVQLQIHFPCHKKDRSKTEDNFWQKISTIFCLRRNDLVPAKWIILTPKYDITIANMKVKDLSSTKRLGGGRLQPKNTEKNRNKTMTSPKFEICYSCYFLVFLGFCGTLSVFCGSF